MGKSLISLSLSLRIHLCMYIYIWYRRYEAWLSQLESKDCTKALGQLASSLCRVCSPEIIEVWLDLVCRLVDLSPVVGQMVLSPFVDVISAEIFQVFQSLI